VLSIFDLFDLDEISNFLSEAAFFSGQRFVLDTVRAGRIKISATLAHAVGIVADLDGAATLSVASLLGLNGLEACLL